MSNNAPFVSQNNYPNVTGTAPFTDQRAVIAGGGGGSGDGNVTFTPEAGSQTGTEGKIEYKNSTTGSQTPIALIGNQFTDLALRSGASATGQNSEMRLTPQSGLQLICRPPSGQRTQLTLSETEMTALADQRVSFRSTAGDVLFRSGVSATNQFTELELSPQQTSILCVPSAGQNTEVTLTGTTADILASSTVSLGSTAGDITFQPGISNAIRMSGNISAQSEVIDFARDSLPPRNTPIYRFINTQIGGADYVKFTNSPVSNGDVLMYNGIGNGSSPSNPKELVWTPPGAPTGLSVNFDKDISTLKLEDTAGGTTTTLSTTAVVPGRTVQIARHTINTYGTDISIFDLAAGSGSTPPGPSSKLVGNNPPRVLLDPQGNTQWQVGNSFRLTASGRLNNFTLGDRVQVKIWSNRGQTLQTLLGSFNVNTTDSSTTQIGWKMYLEFTCRTLSGGGFPPVPGTFSANAQFLYSDDATVREVLGAVWVNNSTSFNTDIDQYFDVTFQLNGSTNSLAVDLAVIERLY
jgi:hypothetical protein